MCLNPGDIVGENYEIISKLTKGGFSQTYTARDKSNPGNNSCVVKEINIPKSQNPQLLEDVQKRFKREAQSLQLLGNHPQIPELFAYLQEKGKFYLIQEYIEGEDLKQELSREKQLNEKQVIELLREILEVLKFVHDRGVIHRDVKPSNLIRRQQDGKIVLIDFGAVKEINSCSGNTLGEVSKTRIIGTENYMPPETQAGKPKFSSDIYAVGIIGIQAITGLHPKNFPTDPRTGELIWRFATHDKLMLSVNLELETLINKMVRYHFKDRYQSVDEVLAALSEITPSTSTPRLATSVAADKAPPSSPTGLFANKAFGFGLGLATSIFSFLVIVAISLAPKTCNLDLGDDLSCGEEILSDNNKNSLEKQEGVKAFASGDYEEAITWFEQARQKEPNDPETLIYLNNAKLTTQRIRVYTIAAAVPLGISEEGGDIGREILRGVAQFQQEFNQRNQEQGLGLRIVIAHDDNSLNESRYVARNIANQSGILAVIGHYSSDNTLATLPIYEKNNLVLISPTSTADLLSNEHPFFFRTVPKNSFYADALADYLLETTKNEKVAVFYTPNSTYSQSLHDRFFHVFYEAGGQVEKQYNLSQKIFAAETNLEQAGETEATALVLFPDANVDPENLENTLEIIKANQNRYLMVGGDSLYIRDILEVGELAQNLIVSIPWHHLDSFDTEFTTTARQLWPEQVSWRTAMGYDAALTLIVAIENESPINFIQWVQSWLNPNIQRIRIQESLKDANFTANGATGEISFELSGDRQERVANLVKIVPDRCSPYGYSFIPLEYSTAETAGIECDREVTSNK